MAAKNQSKSSSGKSTRSNASAAKGDLKGKKKVTLEEVSMITALANRCLFDFGQNICDYFSV